MEAIIKKCLNCGDSTSPAVTFQNGKYGHGNRVFCPSQKKEALPKCTVCATRR